MSADLRPAKDDLTQQLSAMFQQLQSRPVPDSIMSVVDQLDGDTESDLAPPPLQVASGT
ncbi:hypothetical protein [Phenylobacterium sp.]|uniref:hypothetical protein n=1 Tax=Phenylobacterium sp. TaxID=1871053 RepID=UPI002732183D|nr:hypothetical protein [Phenylobacterium sp.]MDP1616467.1 hypothetical protein [Phenylobacterium sp.]MDP1988014.1 hypothetical protein [Phenylobacterium sp.]